ncbi:hypothetical protein ACFYS8_01750 [Kitasatospora sp. NPDC004615]|uniref:hypothetical protein n=1 Tax=Kitasatospora sp. NPDC004615 TaxID=3364017 RepID=UPI0036ABC762
MVLTGSLNNLSLRLADVQRHDEALAVTREVVDFLRRLAADAPARQEAEALYRSLVAARPSLIPELNAVLGVRAKALDVMGRRQEAAEARRRKVPDSSR